MSHKNQKHRTETPSKETSGDPPEQVVRLGTIKAAIWLNTTGEGDTKRTYRTVSLARRFQQDGSWSEQRITLYPNDIPVIAQVLDEVMRRLFALQTTSGDDVPV